MLLLQLMKEGKFVVLFLIIIVFVVIALFATKILIPMVKFMLANNWIQRLYVVFSAASKHNDPDFNLYIEKRNGEKLEFSNLEDFRTYIENYANYALEYYDKKVSCIYPWLYEGEKNELIEILSDLRMWHWKKYGLETN